MPIRGVQIDFKNINVAVKETTILKDVSGYALPGQLMAIMGPSGSGKTTLLNVLAGRGVGTLTGEIMMNKTPLNKKLKRKIAFVLQEDILFENLTLRDTLTYTAQLKLSNELTYAEKIRMVDDIVDTLDMRKCLDTQIGSSMDRGLSGGEKKRANIGSELLNDPAVLYLDEPTSGLDSNSACSLIEVLKKYATSHSKTVITSIHQPSSQIFYQFDRLILLSEGEVVYFGDAHAVMDYFANINLHCYIPNYNAADFILDKVKGSKEELVIIHNAAKKQSWKSFPSIRLSRQASEQLQQIIHHAHSPDEGSQPDGIAHATDSIALDMMDGDKADRKFESIGNGEVDRTSPDLIASVNFPEKTSLSQDNDDQLSLSPGKCTCNRGNNIDVEGALPWCDVCIAKASPIKASPIVDMDLDRQWPTTWSQQFRVLVVRAFKQSKSLFLKQIDLVRHTLLAIIIGVLYFQVPHTEERIHDIRGLLFIGVMYWHFEACFGAVTLFPVERVVIDKERSSGTYRLSAYFLAKMASELPLLIIFPTFHLTVWYWMGGLNAFLGAFFTQWVILIANALTGQSIGLAISAFSSDFKIAILLMDVYGLTTVMLGGFFVETLPSWLLWLQYLSPFYYLFNLVVRVEFNMRGEPVRCLDENSIFDDCFHGNSTHVDGNEVLDSLGILDLPVWVSATAIPAFIIVFRLTAYLILKFKYKPK